MMNNYFVFGGVRRDIFDLGDVKDFLKILKNKIKDYERIIDRNPIFKQRNLDEEDVEETSTVKVSSTVSDDNAFNEQEIHYYEQEKDHGGISIGI